jgi:hypothetical protein
MSKLAMNTNTDRAYTEITRNGKLSDIASRWIGRCKKCGATHKLEGHVMLAKPATSSTRDLIVEDNNGLVYMTDALGSDPSNVTVRCKDHWCRLARVHEGEKKSKHSCGARCTNATGPNCDCQCKGANHGSNC